MQIGEKIRLFGEQNFKRIKDFAEALDMPPSSLQIYMRGESGPGPKMLARLRKLGCDLNWLFDDEETAPPAISPILMQLEELKKENKELRNKIEQIDKLIDR